MMKAINLSVKTLLVALLLTMSACFEIETFTSENGVVSFNGFGIELFQTGGTNDRVLAESTWKHVYKNSAKIEIENKVNGQKYTLDYNPNNFTQAYRITLPYGNYAFSSVVEGGEFEPFLPFKVSGEFTLSSESMDIILQATTDYGLITVKNQFVTSAVVSTGENSPVNLALLGDESFRFIYARGGTPTKLEIIESYSGTTIERNLNVVKYRHYNYILELSEGNVNFIDLVMGAFEYEEELISIGSNLQVGDSFQGGIIAYFFEPGDYGYDKGLKGIIVAEEDLPSKYIWKTGSPNDIFSSLSPEIGYGKINTEKILELTLIYNFEAPAVEAASKFEANGYNDWFLPTEFDLLVIKKNLADQGLGNFFTTPVDGNDLSTGYWSSSVMTNFFGARAPMFAPGAGVCGCAYFESYFIRPIRYF